MNIRVLRWPPVPLQIEREKLHGCIDVGLSVMSVKKSSKCIDLDTEEHIYHLKVRRLRRRGLPWGRPRLGWGERPGSSYTLGCSANMNVTMVILMDAIAVWVDRSSCAGPSPGPAGKLGIPVPPSSPLVP